MFGPTAPYGLPLQIPKVDHLHVDVLKTLLTGNRIQVLDIGLSPGTHIHLLFFEYGYQSLYGSRPISRQLVHSYLKHERFELIVSGFGKFSPGSIPGYRFEYGYWVRYQCQTGRCCRVFINNECGYRARYCVSLIVGERIPGLIPGPEPGYVRCLQIWFF